MQSVSYSGAGLSYTQTFSYDSLNRLQTAQENSGSSWSQTNGYDQYGNRWIDYGGGIHNLSLSATTNRITTGGYGYDSSGNLLNDTLHSYAFDAENKIKNVDGAAAYVYDGGGQRVRKLVGENTRFVYGIGGQLIQEFDGANGTLKKEYVYGGGMQATIDSTNGTQYTTTDALGSPRVVTNSAGSVVSRHDYMPFGEELFAGMGGRTTQMGYGSSDGLRKKFTGYERDTETGLDFAQARYYANTQGRFTSPDPVSGHVSSPQSWNRYAYVTNNPVNLTDSTGLMIDASRDWESVGAQLRERDPRGPKMIASDDNSAAEAGFDWGVSDFFASTAVPYNGDGIVDSSAGETAGEATGNAGTEPQNSEKQYSTDSKRCPQFTSFLECS